MVFPGISAAHAVSQNSTKHPHISKADVLRDIHLLVTIRIGARGMRIGQEFVTDRKDFVNQISDSREPRNPLRDGRVTVQFPDS